MGPPMGPPEGPVGELGAARAALNCTGVVSSHSVTERVESKAAAVWSTCGHVMGGDHVMGGGSRDRARRDGATRALALSGRGRSGGLGVEKRGAGVDSLQVRSDRN